MEEVNTLGFHYGCAIVGLANQNTFSKCSFRAATKAGLVITGGDADSNAYMHPNLSTIGTTGRNTILHFNDCNFRENDFGIIIRNCEYPKFENCVIESNVQAGVLAYQSTGQAVTGLRLDNCWFENNYRDYTSGSSSYSITGYNVLKIATSTLMTWASNVDAGYQIWIGSETEDFSAGPGAYYVFNRCKLAALGDHQRYLRIKSAINLTFSDGAMLGGDRTEVLVISPESTATS